MAKRLGATKLNVVQTDNTTNSNVSFGLAGDYISSVVSLNEDGSRFPKLNKLKKPSNVRDFEYRDFNLVLVEE